MSTPIDGTAYGYRFLNVEAQENDPTSLLTWIKRIVHLRRRHRAFSRGSIELLRCDNPRVLAFARRWEDETIIVVANLAASVQRTAIDLPTSAAGVSVVDIIDSASFPPVSPGSVWDLMRATGCCS